MAIFKCVRCGKRVQPGNIFTCICGGLFEVEHNFPEINLEVFDHRLGELETPYRSGVWRYKELIHQGLPLKQVITRPEGNTNIYKRKKLSDYTGLPDLYLKHEGENPTGSFKDRGMTIGVSMAKDFGADAVICASTGNTSASLAACSYLCFDREYFGFTCCLLLTGRIKMYCTYP
jgi:threonine synthase